MAGLEIRRDAVLVIEKRQVVRRHDADLEPIAAEIIGISFAAAALRVLVESDLLTVVNGSGRGGDHPHRSADEKHEDSSAVHCKPLSFRVAWIHRSHLVILLRVSTCA